MPQWIYCGGFFSAGAHKSEQEKETETETERSRDREQKRLPNGCVFFLFFHNVDVQSKRKEKLSTRKPKIKDLNCLVAAASLSNYQHTTVTHAPDQTDKSQAHHDNCEMQHPEFKMHPNKK